jgi:hypothetical protein
LPADDRPEWPLFAGLVRWRKDPGQPGRLIKRTDADRNESRAGRRYLGVVAETILAADGVLRLRDRGKDPADPVVHFTPPTVAAPANAPPVNDLVWCEGHLRVVGDARLQTGKLDYRVAGGGDDQIPMFLRRVPPDAIAPISKTTLDAFIGPPPLPPGPPVPPLPETRFTVSTQDGAGNPRECLTVVTDGRVGVNAADPSNSLEVKGPTGIRYSFGYITGDEGAAWTAFAFNAFNRPGGPWVIPDPAHRSAAIVLDDSGGIPEIKLQTNNSGNPAAWVVHAVVKGDTGNVGIGNVAPTARLHVRSSNLLQGDIRLFTAAADFEYDGGSDGEFVFRDTGGKTTFVGGDVGIGVRALDRLHVAKTGHLNAVFDLTDAQEHLTVVTGTVGSGLRFSETNDFFIASQPYANRADNTFGTREHLRIKPFGFVGIGTTDPQQKLHVVGDRIRLGTAAKRIDLRTDGAAVDVHSETHSLYLRANGAGAANNKVIINPFPGNGDGNVGIGTEFPTAKLEVSGDMKLNGNAFVPIGGLWFVSDGREKKEVKRIPGALERVLALQGVTFKWRDPDKYAARADRQHGFIAQDVEKVFPEWVTVAPSGEKAVNMTGLDAVVVEALRELTARCERLESEMSTLHKQLAKVEKTLAKATAARKAAAARPSAARRRKAPSSKEPQQK